MSLKRDEIKTLDTREQCRMKLPIWFGSRDNYYHPLLEVLANASDEITNNYENGIIKVTLSDDCKTISVFDSGRGIPILGETNGVKNYELLFTQLFSGTNYSNVENGKITTGANGCGLTVINHTSKLFEVTSYKNNIATTITFIDGGKLKSEIVTGKESEIEHGTLFTFTLDEDVFANTVYEYEEIKSILNRLAGCNNSLVITLKYKEEVAEFHYDNLKEFLYENKNNSLCEELVFGKKEVVEEDGEKNIVEACLSLSAEPLQHTFLNYTYLKENGSVYDGVIDGLKKVFNKELKNKKITSQDIEMSFNMIVSVLSTNVEYANQTKFSTKKQLYKKITSEYIINNMETVKAENPKVFEEMKKHLEKINAFNTNNIEKVKKLKATLNEKITVVNRVKKFIDCRTKDVSKRELFIVEGDSALSSCKMGRNSEFQALIPVRGKILNCLKADITTILESDIITDLMKVLGCGIEVNSKKNKELHSFNLDNLKYDKIIICTDADVDGYQIRCLILTMIYVLAPTLIHSGKVFIVETPLFEIETKSGSQFAYSENERDMIVSSLNERYTLHRSKGLTNLALTLFS